MQLKDEFDIDPQLVLDPERLIYARLTAAIALRKSLRLPRRADAKSPERGTDAYRLVNRSVPYCKAPVQGMYSTIKTATLQQMQGTKVNVRLHD